MALYVVQLRVEEVHVGEIKKACAKRDVATCSMMMHSHPSITVPKNKQLLHSHCQLKSNPRLKSVGQFGAVVAVLFPSLENK